MASKILGPESKMFAQMAFDAVKRIESVSPTGVTKYPISAISILKAHGASLRESELVNGYALNCTRASQGDITLILLIYDLLADDEKKKSHSNYVITELIQLNTRPRDYIIKFVSIILAVFTSLSSLGMPRHIQFPGGTKIAFLDIDLRKTKMALGI
jgi:hypothetical protein